MPRIIPLVVIGLLLALVVQPGAGLTVDPSPDMTYQIPISVIVRPGEAESGFAADHAQTVISGSIFTSITVTVDNSAVDLGPMTVGYNPVSPGYAKTAVHITTSGPISGWSLMAKDTGSLKKGWLLSGSTYPAKALGFSWSAEPWTGTAISWTDLIADRTIATGTYPVTAGDTAVFFRQEVVSGDPIGSYTMTVEFNGALA